MIFDTSSVAAYTIGSGGVGSQTLVITNSGTVELTATTGTNQTINANILLGAPNGGGVATFRNNNTTNSLTLAGSVSGTGTGAKQMIFNGAGNVVVNGAISSAGASTMGLEQLGTGNTTLAGVNTYTGVLNIGSGTLTLSGTLSGGNGISVRHSTEPTYTGNGTFVQTSTGVISGLSPIDFNADNSGTHILAGNNTYTGVTRVRRGLLLVTHDNGLGSTANGTEVGAIAGSQLQLAGGITIGAEALLLTGTGPSNTGALRNISGNNTYGGAITGGAARINSDAGTLTLTGSNANVNFDSTLTLGGAGNIAYTGNIGNGSNSRRLNKDGTGIATLSGTNTYTDFTTVSGGILTFGGTSAKAPALVTATAAGSIGLGVGGAGYYSSANVTSLFNTGTLTGFTLNAASGVAIDTTNAGGSFEQSTALTAARSLTKLGTGTLILSGTNTYNGGTLIHGGILALGSSGALGTSGTIGFGGGTLQYSVSNTTNYSARFSTASGQAYNIDTNGQNVTYTTALTSSGGTLTKSGAGRLTIGGTASPLTNTYSGMTTVTAGTLVINGTVGNGGINVASGAILMGNLTAGGTTTIAAGGVLAVGNSPGTGNFAALNLSGTTVIEFNAGALAANMGTDYDTINVTGSNALSYGGTLNLVFSGTIANSQTFDIFSLVGTATNFFSGVTLFGTGVTSSNLTYNNVSKIWSGVFDLGYSGGSNAQVFQFSEISGDLNVVPEPSTWALLAGGLTALMIFRRRRPVGT